MTTVFVAVRRTPHSQNVEQLDNTWGVQVVRSPNFFLGNGSKIKVKVKVVGDDVAVL
jgi:hypothetical protein